ncbi:MAG: hypothetical protein OEY49_17140 [Candidatus Heimdallarchaeota archaeon]|nr:hypothetical protein [Candidatus Heimdallarchaeota archaeon]
MNQNRITINQSRPIIIKIGGSVLFDDQGTFKTELMNDIMDTIAYLIEKQYKIGLVVGGGLPTRRLVNNLKHVISNQFELDHLSILLTQLHATIVKMLLKNYTSQLVKSYDELVGYNFEHNDLLIMGGIIPGQSTNGATAMCAEAINASIIFNFFNYDKIKTINPTESKDGADLDCITFDELAKLINNYKQSPGHYELFDANALNFVKRSKIPILFVNGNTPKKIIKYINGSQVGTIVQ